MKTLPDNLIFPVSRLFHNTFNAVNYNYGDLTPQEKECITKDEFTSLVQWMTANSEEANKTQG